MKRVLTNPKTRKEVGYDYVISELNIGTPFGNKEMRRNQPFFPGQEMMLQKEFDRIEAVMRLIEEEPDISNNISDNILHCIKDLTFTLERSKENILSMVELYEMKTLLLLMEELSKEFERSKVGIPEEFILADISDLLDIFDPRRDRLNTFYIYEEFSEDLVRLREAKRALQISQRKRYKATREEIKRKYGVKLTPKFEYTVSKVDREELEKLNDIGQLEILDQDYMSVTFTLINTEKDLEIKREIDRIEEELEYEEEKIREFLSLKIYEFQDKIMENCQKIGKLDVTIAKAIFAISNQCIRPILVNNHVIDIEGGRHIPIVDILKKRDKEYMPTDIHLRQGVTCITGANMGGKTVSIKLVGLIMTLAQYGFFVPCQRATLGLSSYIHILIGDSQSVERGLSSFGGEMEELKYVLDHSKERALLLVDEIAGGTNPIEGTALTKSLMDYWQSKEYMTVLTTHFDVVQNTKDVKNLQVIGLENADFTKLNREINYSNRKQRIEVISKYMDYRLKEIEGGGEIPKDALNISKMLGLSNDIIDRAKEYLKGNQC